MTYRKDTKKEEHIERCNAIQAHIDLGRKINDRRLMHAASILTRFLDRRRTFTFEGDPMYLTMQTPEIPKSRFGEFVVEFDSGYSNGLYYAIYRQPKNDETFCERIAVLHVSTSFDPEETFRDLELARERAESFARLLQDCDHEMRNLVFFPKI